MGLAIGSGSVESTIKRLGARLKLSGAQWLPNSVPQMLRLRCAYLNGDISLSISSELQTGMLPGTLTVKASESIVLQKAILSLVLSLG